MSATVDSAAEVARGSWDLERVGESRGGAMATSDQLDPADMYFMSAEVSCVVLRRGGGPMTLGA